MFAQAWCEALGLEPTIAIIVVAAISLFITFITFNHNPSNEIHTVQNGKIISYDTVLVAAPEDKTWPWLAELKAKFRYFQAGYPLMYAAFRKVCLRIYIIPTPALSF